MDYLYLDKIILGVEYFHINSQNIVTDSFGIPS